VTTTRKEGTGEHPLVKIHSRRLLLMALVYAALGMLMLPFAPFMGIAVLVIGGLLASRRYALGSLGQAVLMVNGALERLTRGEDQEAEQILDAMPPRTLKRRYVVRGTRYLRATIAFQRGEFERAVELATACVKEPFERLTVVTGQRAYEERVRAGALALRALARASLGHEAASDQDAAAADAAPGATPEIVARAALARAVVLAAKGDMPSLAAYLGQSGGLILEWSTPRERALLRALRRMARARPKSVYREAAKPDDGAEEGRLAAWIGRVVPGAAAFALDAAGQAATIGSPGPVSVASPEVLGQVERARQDAVKKSGATPRWMTATLVLWVVVVGVGMFAAVGQSMSSSAHGAHHASQAPSASLLLASLVATAFVLFIIARAVTIVRFRLDAKRLVFAQLDSARGKTAEAERALIELVRTRGAMSAAGAHLTLAQLAERKMAWADAVAHCDRGIARLLRNATLKAAASDLLLPELAAMRAFGLAALGRQAEGNAEMAVLDQSFPNYVHKARAHFRFRLVSAVRRGDLEAASEVARARTPNLPLSIRVDMLADVVLAATSAVSRDERERIDAELDDDPELRGWIDALAPGLRERFRKRIAAWIEPAVASLSSPTEAAHVEALAEAEAADDANRAASRRGPL
jgi:hypothetical protein